jgi:hypothetical protein
MFSPNATSAVTAIVVDAESSLLVATTSSAVAVGHGGAVTYTKHHIPSLSYDPLFSRLLGTGKQKSNGISSVSAKCSR